MCSTGATLYEHQEASKLSHVTEYFVLATFGAEQEGFSVLAAMITNAKDNLDLLRELRCSLYYNQFHITTNLSPAHWCHYVHHTSMRMAGFLYIRLWLAGCINTCL